MASVSCPTLALCPYGRKDGLVWKVEVIGVRHRRSLKRSSAVRDIPLFAPYIYSPVRTRSGAKM